MLLQFVYYIATVLLKKDFAKYHPGGTLGKEIIIKINRFIA